MAIERKPSKYDFVWYVSPPPSEAVSVFRFCPRCSGQRCFRCTHKFRVNANRKLVDVWLLFNCNRCDQTARLPVIERVPASRIGRTDLRAFEENDRQLAIAAASNRTLLQRAGFSVLPRRPVIKGPMLTVRDIAERAGQTRALVIFQRPEVALERVLAAQTPVSRRLAQRLLRFGAVRCDRPSALPSGETAVEMVIEWESVRRVLGCDHRRTRCGAASRRHLQSAVDGPARAPPRRPTWPPSSYARGQVPARRATTGANDSNASACTVTYEIPYASRRRCSSSTIWSTLPISTSGICRTSAAPRPKP